MNDESAAWSRTSEGPRLTRRRLATLGAGLAASLAGCPSGTGDGTPTPPSFDHLRTTAMYLDPQIELQLPDEVQTVNATNNADLLVFPANTTVEADQVVDWLAAERRIALLGETAEATWHDWARSEPYRETFGGGGNSDADPDPQLLVAVPQGTEVTTHRYTWANEYDDADVRESLEDALADHDD